MRVHIWPSFEGVDQGDGGVRRVVENQLLHLPDQGWTVEPIVQEADVIAAHISAPPPYLNLYPRTPLVAQIHGLYWSEFAWEAWALKANGLVMELMRVSDAITVPTEWVAQAVRRHTMRRPVVIPHGVNLADWKIWEASGGGCHCPEETIEFGDMKIRTHLATCEGENPGGYVLWNKTRPDPVCDPQAVVTLAGMMPDVQFRSTFGTGMNNLQITGRLPYEAAKIDVERAGAYLCTTRETFGIGTLEALACFPTETDVRASDVTAVMEHSYTGDLITIRTERGSFRTTADHPFWTTSGWVPAGSLDLRHRLLYYPKCNECEKEVHTGSIGEVVGAVRSYASSQGSCDLRGLRSGGPRRAPRRWSSQDVRTIYSDEASDSLGGTTGLYSRPNRRGGNGDGAADRIEMEAAGRYLEYLSSPHGLAGSRDSSPRSGGSVAARSTRQTGGELHLQDPRPRVASSVQGASPSPRHQGSAHGPDHRMVRVADGTESTRATYESSPCYCRHDPRVEYEAVLETTRTPVESLPVYNLKTSSGLYLANGYLVHNCGIPIVGWRWGGQAEFISQGEDGYLATPGDYEDLAKGIRWALEARQDGKTPQRCRDTAAQFPWERAAELYAEVYSDVLYRKLRHEPTIDPKDHWPKVSVIVTAYKLDEYLEGCLKSVLDQTLSDWECIIVDDASPDLCGKIADGYALGDPRFKVIHNETNLYLAGARNAGIALARGEYILPLDADDELTPTALEVLSGALDHDHTIHVAYGNVEFLEVGGEENGKRWKSGWPIAFDIELQWKGPGQLGPYSSMFRREVFELTGGYRTRCNSSEDCDVWLRTSSYGFRPKMVTTETCLVYRNRGNSMSHTEGWQEHRQWYPWVKDRSTAPAGALVTPQLPVHSCDPPLVSVIIPVGPGHEQYVIDAVDSVDAQTFRRWECIVINDTGAPLPTLLPSWVQVIEPPLDRIGHAMKIYKRFGGVAAARNVGIRASKSRYFLPLDADDILEPRCLELMVMVAEDTGKAVYSDFYEDPESPGKYSIYRTPAWSPNLLIQNGTVSAVTQLTLKSTWEKIGGYDESLPAWEDWAFQIDAAALGLCAVRVPLALWTYRKHTGFRRNENASQTDAGKAGIIEKYDGRFWDLPGKPKREELMACRTCGGNGVSSPPTTFNRTAPPPDGAVLVEFIGSQRGPAKTVKTRVDEGGSGTTYRFDPDDGPFYVLQQDVSKFLQRPAEYRVVPTTVDAPVEPETPVLATDAREPAKRVVRRKPVEATV